jgi:diguanylate cyclase (GGDEF)-like protein
MNRAMNASRRGEAPPPDDPGQLPATLLDALETAVVACAADGRIAYANAAAGRLWGGGGAPAPAELADCALFDRNSEPVDGAGHPLRRALGGEWVAGERWYVELDGATIDADVTAQPLTVPGAAAVLTVTPHRESATEARLRTYVSDFEILTEVSRALADVADADEAASIICTVAIGSTGAIAVLLWEVDDDRLLLRWQEGIVPADDLDRLTEQAREGAARAIDERRTQVDHPAGSAAGRAAGSLPGTAWHEPLMAGGRATGALSLVWPGTLTDLDRPGWLIEALAHHAATALERAGLVRRLGDAARTDPLTELANRRVWNERLAHELARAEREGTPLSLILIDIDRFKLFNDSYGHPEGDELLYEAARAWSAQVRTTDLLARVGGEEFAVLLPACPLEDAIIVAERLRTAMPRNQTCSLGVTTWDTVATSSQLYAIADGALYRAKQSGRDQVQVGGQAGEPALPA